MTQKELRGITLDTPIFHPFYGGGNVISVERWKVTVKFNEYLEVVFGDSGSRGKDHFLEEIYLHPVKIVEK